VKNNNSIRIANAQAFWGDRNDAAATLLSQDPHIDFITLDYLAEVSLSIMAIQKEREPAVGYARDFLNVVRSLIPFWKKGVKTKIVTNAGGLNPEGCGRACIDLLRANGCESLKVAIVTGDDVLSRLKEDPTNTFFYNFETKKSVESVLKDLVTANAYIGADSIADALRQGTDLVITGRVADPSLTVAPCMAHFGWSENNYNAVAGATVAGHLIECGTQATGGFSTDWLNVPNLAEIGFPIVEVQEDGSCFVTKPNSTGGEVTIQTVKEQLLYEIGDPGNYLSPDVTVSFLTLSVKQAGKNKILVSGATGRPATSSYKVSATYRDGYKAHGILTIFGQDAVKKARKCGEILLNRLAKNGNKYQRSLIECVGQGAAIQNVLKENSDALETVLRVSVADPKKEAVENFSKELASLITAGPQGITGYAAGRPKVQPVFGYWPCLIEKNRVKLEMKILNA
jgi:hypothetical protein